jgi:hypothetical protein
MACGSCGARYNKANGQVVTGIVDPKAPAPRGYIITQGAALPSAPLPSPTAVSSDSQAEQNKSDASEGN